MTTWAVGDLQGCYATFQSLLGAIAFDPEQDALWLVGDLVNRGHGSLEVLRWCVRHANAVTAVLGNHDLHLLAVAAGLRAPRPRDTLMQVLKAPDREELFHWLRHRPLIHRTDTHLLVHAGIPPWWSVAEAETRARRMEGRLRRDPGDLLLPLPGARPLVWDASAPTADRLALAGLTTIRCLDADQGLVRDFNGPPEERPPSVTPWFQGWNGPPRVVFGHWAALGHRATPDVLALDSGCVWGRTLTAVCLATDRTVQVPNCEPLSPG